MKMLNDKVLLKSLELDEEERGGLIVVNQKKAISLCEVLNVSDEELDIHVGDRVLAPIDRMASIPQGKLIDRKDILCIVEP